MHLTVVTGSEKMAELRKFFMASESHDPLYGAPAFIVVSAKPGTVGTLDAGAIIENMLLAAADLGLGTCFIAGCLLGTKDPAKLRSILQIPEGFEVKSGITLGHAADSAPAKTLTERFSCTRL